MIRLPLFVGALLALSVGPAIAEQMACAEYSQLTKGLATRGEVPIGHGTDIAGFETVLFASPAGDWMIVIIVPPERKYACIRGIGASWAVIFAQPPSTGL